VNLCRRLSVLAPGTQVQVEDLPHELVSATPSGPVDADWARALASWADRQAMTGKKPLLDEALPEFERVLIRSALKRTQGHRQEAAKLLGWGRNTLTRKLKELGMNDVDHGGEDEPE
jgi:two-component system nitrogen regulation response regulator GlnG